MLKSPPRKGKKSSPRKSIDRDYQFKICLWIALRKTDPQIVDLLKDRMDIDMSYQNVRDSYRRAKRWQPTISYLRERYLKNISRIPIADSAHRLWMLNEAADEALTWHTKSVNEYGKVMEKKIGIIPALIKEARIEIEGDKDTGQKFIVAISFPGLKGTVTREGVSKDGDKGRHKSIRPSTKTSLIPERAA